MPGRTLIAGGGISETEAFHGGLQPQQRHQAETCSAADYSRSRKRASMLKECSEASASSSLVAREHTHSNMARLKTLATDRVIADISMFLRVT
jgi:hypothetical protein